MSETPVFTPISLDLYGRGINSVTRGTLIKQAVATIKEHWKTNPKKNFLQYTLALKVIKENDKDVAELLVAMEEEYKLPPLIDWATFDFDWIKKKFSEEN